jgi:hypothetical protein
MYAMFTEVNADESTIEVARALLRSFAVARAREWGAKGGYWLAPVGGRGVSVVVFETEDEARKAADNFEIGKQPMPNAPAGVTMRTIEVREVLATV